MRKRVMMVLCTIVCIFALGACSAGQTNSLGVEIENERDAISSESRESPDGQIAAIGENTEVNPQAPEATSAEVHTPGEETQELSGYDYGADGENIPVTLSFSVEDVIRGEAAEQALTGSSQELPQPGEGEEYIVITLKVTYVDGGAETLFLMENIASLSSANLFFSLKNGNSNATNITTYLSDSIHDCEINKGESAEGKVAFIHYAAENGPLVFHGFDNTIELNIAR